MTEAACEGGAATTTWVYVGGMDFFWDDEEVQHFLRLMAGRHGVVRSLRLEGFKEDALRQERRRRHQGKCHQARPRAAAPEPASFRRRRVARRGVSSAHAPRVRAARGTRFCR